MRALKIFLAAAAIATATLTGGGVASAATFTSVTSPGPDGSLSWDFGNTGDIAEGDFEDVFAFTLPEDGVLSGSIQSTYTSDDNELTFTSVKVSGNAFSLLSFPGLHMGSIAMLALPGGGTQLIVKGVSPGVAGSYTGHLTFTPTAVLPEPGAWALMILGFGGAGVALRARGRAQAVRA